MNHLINITKFDGTKELFEEEKLASSLEHVGASEEVVDEIVSKVEREMKEGMTTAQIYRRAFELLKQHSKPIAVKYSIRRALMELGPDGFPFEKFVARIFQVWGYETVVDQTLMGTCIPHEMDVVAWKDKELAMVEAKFHNEFGLRSDIKVVLYIKSRFDDLSETLFDYGGVKRKLTDRWLFTNTKFTDVAIKYGECKDLKLVGWNYPVKGNLHEIIEQHGLHPITCLSSLSHSQKKDLIGLDVLVCRDLVDNIKVLNEVGIKGEAAEKIILEARVIINIKT